MNNFNPKISSLTTGLTQGISGFGELTSVHKTTGENFETVLSGMVQNINETVVAPDTLMEEAVLGKADVHDVMAAISKSEIQINLAASVTKKILQTYEKVMNIQI